MGAESSKIVAMQASSTTFQVADLLSDPRILKIFQSEFGNLPITKQRAVRDVVTRHRQRKKVPSPSRRDTQGSYPRDPWSKKSHRYERPASGIPDAFLHTFHQWETNPASFFEIDTLVRPQTQADLYQFTKTVSNCASSCRIRLRFIYDAFYQCRSKTSRSDWVPFRATLVDDEKTIMANIKRWTFYGKRLHQLASKVGGAGCYFLLPESINDRFLSTLKKDDDIADVAEWFISQNIEQIIASTKSDLVAGLIKRNLQATLDAILLPNNWYPVMVPSDLLRSQNDRSNEVSGPSDYIVQAFPSFSIEQARILARSSVHQPLPQTVFQQGWRNDANYNVMLSGDI